MNNQRCVDFQNYHNVQKRVFIMSKEMFPQGVLVPLSTIKNVYDTISENYRPPVSDMFTKYHINPAKLFDENLIHNTATFIWNDVKQTYMHEEKNFAYDIKDTILGPTNKHGIQNHPAIKLKKRIYASTF